MVKKQMLKCFSEKCSLNLERGINKAGKLFESVKEQKMQTDDPLW